MTNRPKDPTAAQRQAARKARELAAGRVYYKRWLHPGDVAPMDELAKELTAARAKPTKQAP